MEAAVSVDPYELLEAVEILSKMPKDFYEKIVSSPQCLGQGSLIGPNYATGEKRNGGDFYS